MNTLKTLRNAMHNLKAKLLPYTFATVYGSSLKSTRRNFAQSLPGNLFLRCNELTMDRFIACSCDHDLSTLLKYGQAKEYDLTRAWEMIYSEYSDMSGNPQSHKLIKLSKDIPWHDAKLKSCSLALLILKNGPNKDAIHVLKDIYGYHFPFDWSKQDEYFKTLEAIAGKLSSVKFTIQHLSHEFQQLSKSIEGKPMTRKGFCEMTAVIELHFHFPMPPATTTVTEFVSRKLRYEKDMEALQRENERMKSNYGRVKK